MDPSPFSLVLSSGLLLGTTTLLARRLTRSPAELLWMAPALVSLQIGALASLLSLGGWMTPQAWLAGQTLVFTLAFLWTRRTSRPVRWGVGKALRDWWNGAPLLARAAIAASVLFVAASGVRQAVAPLYAHDDRNYHASRVAYWMQNASILPYPTHNERQVAFPFGSELYFLWPVLFTKAEAAGRVVFWLGLPLAAVGIHVVAGKAGVREPFRSLAVLLFVSTPIVGSLSLGLAPEFWLAFFEVATAFWILDAAEAGDGPGAIRAAGWVGLFLVLAMNVKTTAVGLAIPAAFLPFVVVRRAARWSAFRVLMFSALVGWTLSGLLLNNIGNLVRSRNPLGSTGLLGVCRSDLNARQLYIHAVRLPFLLLELPWIPARLRPGLEVWGEAAATAVGATQAISSEESKQTWLGRFHFTVTPTATNYSLGGLLWLPGLAAALVVALSTLRIERRTIWTAPLLLCGLTALSSLVPVVFGVRWMTQSAVPVRFLIAPWALGAISLAALASQSVARRRGLVPLAGILVGLQALCSLPASWQVTKLLVQSGVPEAIVNEPFSRVIQRLPAGSRILLLADQGTRDYPLFRPRDGFSNSVIAWGSDAVTLDGVVRVVGVFHATHVLFSGNEWLARHWDPPIRVAEALSDLARNVQFRDVSSRSTQVRLFEVVSSDEKRDSGLSRGDGVPPNN